MSTPLHGAEICSARRPGSRAALAVARKVRTPKGKVLGNTQAGKPDGECNRKNTA
jgi:hypothetical protein